MKKALLLLIILFVLTVQLVVAVEIPRRSIGIIDVNYMTSDLVETNISPITQKNKPTRTIMVIEPENESHEQVPLQGDVVKLDNFSGYYVMLNEDLNDHKELDISSSKLIQEPIVVEKPIYMEQTINVTNKHNYTINHSVNLWDYKDVISETYLKEAVGITIYLENNLQSESPIFNLIIEPNETKTYFLKYEYSPIHREINCETKTIIDLLPPGAIIKNIDLPLDTPISNSCTVSVSYEGGLLFENVEIPLDGIESELITSVTHVQTGEKLDIKNNIITITTQ